MEELKHKLNSRNTSVSTNPEETLREQKIREAANYRNEIESLRFELQQIRNENFEINNRYSDYYIVKEDNQELRSKV